MLNITEINKMINDCAIAWETSGAVAIYKDENCCHRNVYGLADRAKKLPITEQSTYLIPYHNRFLMGLCIGKLIDDKKLKLSDTLDKYIKEYNHAMKISVKQLCLKQTGIPDFFNGQIMKELQETEEYKIADNEKRSLIERKLSVFPWSFDEVLSRVNGMELTCVPGTEPTDDLDNMSETLFIREVIERASKKSLADFVQEEIFKPLIINAVYKNPDTNPYSVYRNTTFLNSEYESDEINTFSITFAEAEKLLNAVLEKKLLSEKAWKAISTVVTLGQSIAFNSLYGLLSVRDFCYGNLGWNCNICVDWDTKLGFLYLTNSEHMISRTREGVRYFLKELLEETAAAFIYPKNTKLVPFNKDNLWDTMRLSIRDDQLEFMNNAQRAICIASAYKQKLFVLSEGSRSVGLIAFSVDKKHQKYYIESVLIDQKYQQRGFGKIMLVKGIDYLKTQGCKHLTIGVHRFNVAAQKLYTSVGFSVKTVYDDFIEMEAELL